LCVLAVSGSWFFKKLADLYLNPDPNPDNLDYKRKLMGLGEDTPNEQESRAVRIFWCAAFSEGRIRANRASMRGSAEIGERVSRGDFHRNLKRPSLPAGRSCEFLHCADLGSNSLFSCRNQFHVGKCKVVAY